MGMDTRLVTETRQGSRHQTGICGKGIGASQSTQTWALELNPSVGVQPRHERKSSKR